MQPRPAERQPSLAARSAAVRAAPVVVAAPPSASQALQRKLGTAGLSAMLAGHEQRVGRVAANPSGGPMVARSPAQALVVSSPSDAAEREAEKVGRRVMSMSPPGPAAAPRVGKPEAAKIARAAAPAPGPPAGAIDPEIGRELEAAQSGGSHLPMAIRNHMERSFHADFSPVRIHTDERAARLSVRLAARAFTRGNHIFFARGAFSPETRSGGELIAHELTHTIQQRAVVQHAQVQRAANPEISERATPHVQRSALSDPLGFLAERANAIPGFRMFTIVLGVNPINMAPVDRSDANVLRAVVEFIPGGVLITAALDAYGIFDRVGGFIDQQLRSLGITGAAIRTAVTTFIDSLGVSDIFSPGDVWNRAVAIFSTPIRRIIDFVAALGGQVLDFIRDAILRPLANLASQTRGWDLLTAVLGKNPITGEAVPRTAETLIGGFMKLIGQEEVWENAKKSNAVPRAWAWFQGALATVVAFVSQIPGLFLAALCTLGIADLAALPSAFARVAGVFANFVGQFFTWAGTAVWNLLEIIFDVVSPGALGYIKKTGAALKSILKNPLPFVGNLVRAAKLGLQNFADNFGTHLKAGLIDWLTGSLPGVYIPKAFSLVEVGKFALSVLGITWAQIRGKIVKALGPTGETIMKGLETGFDIVVALVKGGPAAAWEVIKDKLTNLKDMVIEGITSFVVDTIVKKAIPKLVSMFIPGAGFISAILSIYDTVMVFVQKLAKIAAAVIAFIDSIVAIAAGQIDAAAKKVESTLAGLLSLAISFLAGFLGLGNIASKVMGVIEKVRAAVDKALDTAIAWIVGKAKALFAKLFGKKDKKDERTDAQKQADLDKAVNESDTAMAKEGATPKSVQKDLLRIKAKYRLTTLELVKESGDAAKETDYVVAEINPKKKGKAKTFEVAVTTKDYEVVWSKDATGRTVSAKATLKEVFTGATRSSQEVSAQSKSAAKGKVGDVGGHIIGHRFVKDQGIINMFPQNARFNNSAWKTMENEWAAAIKAGHHVVVDIVFGGGTLARPEKVAVSYKFIDVDTGQVKHSASEIFKNDEFQKFSRLSTEEIGAL